MKEHPILFSTGMVRAILDGRKTQTRRIVSQPVSESDHGHSHNPMVAHGGVWYLPNEFCPYGIRGDHLWVRETWRPYGWGEDSILIQYRADMAKVAERGIEFDPPNYDDWYERIFMAASDQCEAANCKMDDGENYTWDSDDECPIKWKPGIFLPRWASRITLEIVNVRVERIRDITKEDAKSEGAADVGDKFNGFSYIDRFRFRWDHINAKRGFGWYDNPWVWVIEFKKLESPQRKS